MGEKKITSKRRKKKRSKRRKAKSPSYFVEALIAWVSFQNACSEARYDFIIPSLYRQDEQERQNIKRSFDVLLQDVEITKARIELYELQLDYESEYSDQYKLRLDNNTKKGIFKLSETNLREFNNTLKGNRTLIRQSPSKPMINRSTRKFLLEDHDYMNVVETNLDDDSSDEDVARINNKLNEAFVRLQSKDFSKRKCHGQNCTYVCSETVCIDHLKNHIALDEKKYTQKVRSIFLKRFEAKPYTVWPLSAHQYDNGSLKRSCR